jgi:hypothetical protein
VKNTAYNAHVITKHAKLDNTAMTSNFDVFDTLTYAKSFTIRRVHAQQNQHLSLQVKNPARTQVICKLYVSVVGSCILQGTRYQVSEVSLCVRSCVLLTP